ncbi:helix-turn-helix domain-containing protein [Sphingobium sp.]|uniref:TetR/AcrR family transcriptional regulator n=1 Tax=Sphingobium sp. TaxID=1912891 RepID=UPI0028BF4782|nr:helix-turn-helix domain-containing protein [Sphingobium sp.]
MPAEDGGRLARKRRQTRAQLLEAAYRVMSEQGIDASKIKDITDLADVGFGTFYNYFESKDQLASMVLDCLINDFGRRSVEATRGLGRRDPALVIPVSIRLMLTTVIADPLWQWWALRPDLLLDRMRKGFGPFGMRDMREAVRRGICQLSEDQIPLTWDLAVWVMVGGIHDVVVGDRPPGTEKEIAAAIMRLMGVEPERALQISSTKLPAYPAPDIDWMFTLETHPAKADASPA